MHVHSGAWLKAARAARRAGVPRVVHTVHGLLDEEPWFGPLMKRAAARITDAVLSVSEPLRHYLVDTCQLDPACVTVVLNGISTTTFRPGGDRQALRARLGVAGDGPVIGHVARLAPVKNQGLLLDGFALAHQSQPTAILVVAGDGPERQALEERAESLGVRGAVFFLGEIRDAATLYRDFDIFALTSVAEGTSISVLEALASGVAVIATAVGGNPALLDQGRAGVLVPTQDVAALGVALTALMADDARRRSLAAAGRAHVERVYSEHAMVERHLDIYRRGRAALTDQPCAA
jgi:glycosyltransferase involved in cell wall biosynthesis